MLDRLLSGVEPRQAQQVAHQALHPQRVPADDLEEAPDLRGFGPLIALIRALIEQRLDVAADSRERRAQLVRDVGDEVTANAIGAAEIGDVVHDEHRAGRAWRLDRRAPRHDDELGLPRQRQLEAFGRRPAKRRAELRGDVGLAHDLDVVPALGVVLQPQHRARGLVDELHAAVVVDDQHALDHAAQDRFHPGPIRGEIGRAAADFTRRVVQDARDGADLVTAVVSRRTRPVAARIPLRDRGNRLHAPAEQHGGRPRHGQRGEEADAERDECDPSDGGQLLGHVRERQRQAHESQGGQRRVVDRHRDVQQVGPDGGAVPAGDAQPVPPRLLNLRPLAVVLDLGERLAIQLRIADDDAVGRDERDACADQAAERIRLAVELGGAGGLPVRKGFGGQTRLADEGAFDAIAHGPR